MFKAESEPTSTHFTCREINSSFFSSFLQSVFLSTSHNVLQKVQRIVVLWANVELLCKRGDEKRLDKYRQIAKVLQACARQFLLKKFGGKKLIVEVNEKFRKIQHDFMLQKEREDGLKCEKACSWFPGDYSESFLFDAAVVHGGERPGLSSWPCSATRRLTERNCH